MADLPYDGLGGKTPLEAANKPNIDNLAQQGTILLSAKLSSLDRVTRLHLTAKSSSAISTPMLSASRGDLPFERTSYQFKKN